MFQITEKNNQVIIQLTRGNSAEFETEPYIIESDGTTTPIILDSNDYVLFCVTTPSGKQVMRKQLSVEDYNEESLLAIKIIPADTINLEAYRYIYSLSYMPNEGESAYTYAQGIFEILPVNADINDLEIPTQEEKNGN